jgi:histidyl-tRNA synthetase
MQSLPGFRDFYPEDFARRDYLFRRWRAVARRYGFVEMDGPVLETTELYEKKNESGAEILTQLYAFTDRGDRRVAMRPEMTPTLARMVIAKERNYRKPIKWFSIAPFFRYERQQKGRLREFIQFNADLLGDSSASADAELIALVIDLLRELGFTASDFVIRLSDRRAWTDFLAAKGCTTEAAKTVLAVVDKLERDPAEALEAKLAGSGVTLEELRGFISGPTPDSFHPLLSELAARGMADFVTVDLSIVRGLAYYTGVVFEAFDRGRTSRALCGGGRYDTLLADLSDGSVNLPAIGFGMGDVVLANLIEELPHTRALRDAALAADPTVEIYCVIADESRRADALAVVQSIRSAGRRCDFPLGPAKIGKQFQAAEAAGAKVAVLVGSEFPELKIKDLAARTETTISQSALAEWLNSGAF